MRSLGSFSMSRNILLLSYNGVCEIRFDEKPEFEIIVTTWNEELPPFPHSCLGVYYSPTQRHGEAMYIQSLIVKELNLDYDYIASFNHDLQISVSQINRYFKIATENKLDLFGASTTSDSYYSHKMFIKSGKDELKDVEWVEMMAMGMSKRLYKKLSWHMKILYGELNLVSGWGLDNFLLRQIVKENNYNCKLIDSISVRHINPVTKGSVKWRNGLDSKKVLSIMKQYVICYSQGVESFVDFVLSIKNKSRRNRITYTQVVKNISENTLLAIRVSYKGEQHKWDSFRRQNLKGSRQIIICGDEELDANYKLTDDVLYLKCKDNWEDLPEKMIAAYSAIREMKEFEKYDTFLKLDADVISNSNFNPYQLIQITSECNYVGAVLRRPNKSQKGLYHLSKSISPNSAWYGVPYTSKEFLSCKFCAGGKGYLLSRESLNVICKKYNFTNLSAVKYRFIYEDAMIAILLSENNIKPTITNLSLKDTNPPRTSRRKIHKNK